MIAHLREDEQHRHPNGGGWVANTAYVADTVYVGPDAQVYGNTIVSGYVNLYGYVSLFGSSLLPRGTGIVSGNSKMPEDDRAFEGDKTN